MFNLLEKYKQDTGKLGDVDLLTDFQLQIEHAVDLERRENIVFIDASTSCSSPCELHRIRPERDHSYTTHALSPAAVLAVYEQINGQNAPASYMLSIRGYAFELGMALSSQASTNLQQGFELVTELLATGVENWVKKHVI